MSIRQPGRRLGYHDQPATVPVVVLDLEFADETFEITRPMVRWLAEAACFDFAAGIEWKGKRVTKATVRPVGHVLLRHPTSAVRWHD